MVSPHRRASPAIDVELSILSVFLGTRQRGRVELTGGQRSQASCFEAFLKVTNNRQTCGQRES